MKKSISLIMCILLMLSFPVTFAFADDTVADSTCGIILDTCTGNLGACEELLDESMKRIADLEGVLSDYKDTITELEKALKSCEKDNANDGDISLADLFAFVPGFGELEKRTQAMIVVIATTGIAVGLSFLPPPTNGGLK